MKNSKNRILVTHSGSIPRPPDIQDMILAKQSGQAIDQKAFASRVQAAVADVVRKQVETGIDVPTDGEFGKSSFLAYANERL